MAKTPTTPKTPPPTTTEVVKQTKCNWIGYCWEVIVSTTTTPKATPKQHTEKVTAEEVVAWFGFLEDEPDKDGIDIDVGEKLLAVDNLLNSLIRKQLSNYSIESKELMELAEEAEHKQTETSLTWVKVKDRFLKFENASRKSASFVGKWKVEKNLFGAIHEEVKAANHSVTLKTDVVSIQCKAAVNKAHRKLESMETHLESQREKNKNAADPVEFKDAKDKVTMATENLNEIRRLKQLHPKPCLVLEQAGNAIKMNITELRKKITKAKLLASSLKLAISAQKGSPLVYKIPKQHSERDPLRNSISVMLHHTGSDGHVISLHAEDEETVSMEMSDNKLQVIQYIDGYKEVLNVANTNNITDQQYLLEIERYGTVYNFTMKTEDGIRLTVGTKSLFETSKAYSTEYLPTSLQIGGSDSLSTCFLGLQVNGHYVDWLKKKNKDSALPVACESQSRWLKFDSHLLYEGSGFASYDLARRTIKSFSISFNPKSPGTIFVMNSKRHSVLIDAYIDWNNTLAVYIKYKKFISQLVTMVTFGMDHDVKFTFKSRGIQNVDITLNRKSDVFKIVEESKRSIIDPSVENDKLYIGGLPEQNSSFVGCIKAMSINDDNVLFETFEEAEDVKFGTCQTKNCVQFDDSSSHIAVKSLPSVKVIYLVVEKGSLGPVLQFSKNKEKFNLSITLHSDSVSIEETVKEDSDEIYIDEDAQKLVISVQEDAEDESLTVTVNEEYEEVSYSSRTFWGTGGEDDDDVIYTYDINIGGSTEDEKVFTGTISDLIIDGSPFSMLPYMEDHHLAGCQSEPTPKKTKTAKVYPKMTCE